MCIEDENGEKVSIFDRFMLLTFDNMFVASASRDRTIQGLALNTYCAIMKSIGNHSQVTTTSRQERQQWIIPPLLSHAYIQRGCDTTSIHAPCEIVKNQ